MEAGSLYCIWAPICTEERKVNIDLKREKAQTTGCFDFSGNVTPSTPQTQEQRTEHSTFGTITHRILQRKWSGSWSCWCAEVHAPPPDTMIIVWHYILLMKKNGIASFKVEGIGAPVACNAAAACPVSFVQDFLWLWGNPINCLHQNFCIFITNCFAVTV